MLEPAMVLGASSFLSVLALLSLVGCSSTGASGSPGGAGSAGVGNVGAAAGDSANGGSPNSNGGASNGGVVASGGASTVANGMVVGPPNSRCTNRAPGAVDTNSCFVVGKPSGGDTGAGGTSAGGTAGSAAGGGTAGMADCNLAHDSGYGDTLYNNEGDDDECKYHVVWTSTPIVKDQPFTFFVTATNEATGEPLGNLPDQQSGTVALSRIEPFIPCDESHLAPTSTLEAPVAQTGPGTFSVGPVVLDASARWVIRYHFYGDCFNNATTPHAHIAFFVDVP